MELTLFTGVVVALCGVGVGILSAMFGIGGGIVMVPLIHMAFGQPAAVASGTSLFAILPTSISGMVARLHDGTIRFPVGIAVGLAGACLSPLGAVAASNLPGVYAMVLTAFFILFTAYNLFKRVWRTRPSAKAAEGTGATGAAAGATGAAAGASQPAAAASQPAAATVRRAPLQDATGVRLYGAAAVLGAVVGLLSGYLGLGGGFLIVPLLQFAFGFTMKQATGTSLVAVAIFAVPSFIAHAILGNVMWVLGLLLIVGSVFGAKIGAAVIKRVNDRLLTALFAVLLVVAGVVLAANEFIG